jgi:DNA polymerase-3 subunit gamma/tau
LPHELPDPRGRFNAYTPAGRAVMVEPRVVDLSRLVPSHDPEGRLNPAYPHAEGVQPRDRSAAPSAEQVRRIVAGFQPARLLPNVEAGAGAPIVNPHDLVVESGNGRVMALMRVFRDPLPRPRGRDGRGRCSRRSGRGALLRGTGLAPGAARATYRGGRPAADGRLANPVRSGRKQPQRGSARVARRSSTRSARRRGRRPCGGGRPGPGSAPVAPAQARRRAADGDRPGRMASTLFGDDEPPPPPPDGPGLFGDAPPPPALSGDTPPAPEPPGLFGDGPPDPAPAYRVLARKYRPHAFADLIGQEALVRTLRNAFAQNRVAHAFMLTGVRGVGKTTTARIIARAMNCIGPTGAGGPTAEPCGICPECRAILADRHPDVLELDAASNNGVDAIREIREAVRFRPAQGRFKIYILDEVHMLSTAAFNALLKTLEEPPPAVKFLFATTELRKVPATILSRCQTFHLKRVPQETLRAHFAAIAGREGMAAEAEAIGMVARAADGSVRDGLSLLDQAIALAGADRMIRAGQVADMLGLADRGLVFDLMEAVLAGALPRALSVMDTLHERGADPGVVLSDLLELTHLLTRMKAVPGLAGDGSLSEIERGRGGAMAARLSVPVLGRAWQVLLKGVGEVAEAPDRKAAAEMVLIRLAHLAEMPTPGEILRRLTEGGGAAPAPRPAPGGPAGGLQAVAGGGRAVALPADAPAAWAAAAPRAEAPPEAPRAALPRGFREAVALAGEGNPALHAHLIHSVHPVRFAEARIEIRVMPDAPRDLAARFGAALTEATGTRWTIALSNEPGEPTLAEQGRAADAGRREDARHHPLVQAVLAAFPGAVIEAVRDRSLDAYGLAPVPEEPGDMPEFAPPDAESAWAEEDPG